MPVRSLSLTGFRSYPQLEIELGDGPHVIVGPNAAGKTNLVESLVLLSAGRSHRSSADVELVRWGSDFARASGASVGAPARIDGARRSSSRCPCRAAAPASGSASTASTAAPAALAPVLRTVLFAPEDMLLVVGSPSLRRDVLDALVVQREVTAAAVLSTYARALTQRNSLLRRIREEVAGPRTSCATGTTVVIATRAAASSTGAGRRSPASRRPWRPPTARSRRTSPTLALRYVSNVEPRPGETPQRGAAPPARRRPPTRRSGTAPRSWGRTATTWSSKPAAAT